jgi:hypothetical protein
MKLYQLLRLRYCAWHSLITRQNFLFYSDKRGAGAPAGTEDTASAFITHRFRTNADINLPKK